MSLLVEFDDGETLTVEGKVKSMRLIVDAPAAAAAPAPTVTPKAGPEHLSLNEVAERLGCSRARAFALVKSGVIVGHQISAQRGSHWRVSRWELERYLARRKGEPVGNVVGIQEASRASS